MRRMMKYVGLATVGVLAATAVTGCGGEDSDGRATEASTLSSAFELRPAAEGEHQEAVGHGVSVLVPADWAPSEDEKLDRQGRTYEWAVQAPTAGTGFPPFVSMSMGVPGETSTGYDAAPEALKTIEGVSPEFEVIDEGELDVDGVENAYQLRYLRTATYEGQSVQVEQVQVFLDMPDDVLSTLRFQAPAGEFDEAGMQDLVDSIAVDVQE